MGLSVCVKVFPDSVSSGKANALNILLRSPLQCEYGTQVKNLSLNAKELQECITGIIPLRQ